MAGLVPATSFLTVGPVTLTSYDDGWMRSVPPAVAGGSTTGTTTGMRVDPPATAGGTDLIQDRSVVLFICS